MINFYLVICLAALLKKSSPELPDLIFKSRVNPDTPIPQINGKKKSNITSMKNSFLRMFIIFNIREVSYKGQFIESLPVIKQHRTTAINVRAQYHLPKVNGKMSVV